MGYMSRLDGPSVFGMVAVPGIPINMRRAEAVSFVTFTAAGDQVVTVSESIDGASKQSLAVIDTAWKAPGVGGTWTKVTQTAAATFTHADATNDMAVITVRADQLSAGYTCIEWTSTGTANLAILHGLRRSESAEEMNSPVLTGLELIEGSAAAFFAVWDVDGGGTNATDATQEFVNLVDIDGDKATRGSSTGTDTNDPSVYAAGDEAFVRLPGTASNSFSVPDAAALDIVGDIDIRVQVAMDDWTPAAASTFVSKRGAAGQVSWQFRVGTDGTLTLVWSEDGTAAQTATSTVATGVTDGETSWVRIAVDVDNGSTDSDFTFYTSTDGSTWTQLGDVVNSGAVTSIHSGTASVVVGASFNSADPMAGDFYRAQVYNGIAGTLVLDIDVPTDNAAASQTTFTATTGQTVTLNRSTTGLKTVAVAANKSVAQSDGTDDYIQFPASLTPTFDESSGSYTVLVTARRYGNSGGASANVFSTESATNNGFIVYLSSGSSVTVGMGPTLVADAIGAMADQAVATIGATAADGFIESYNSVAGLTGSPTDATATAPVHNTSGPRMFVRGHLVDAPSTLDWFAVTIFEIQLTEPQMNAVSSYLESLA